MKFGPKKLTKRQWDYDRRCEERRAVAVKAHARLSGLETLRIMDWCDQVGSGMARALSDYRKTSAPESLEEAKMGAITLLVAFELLQDRAD